MNADPSRVIPVPFVKRRLHSIAGLWLAVFLFQHLLTNSQAALFLGSDGRGFIETVNSIHSFPYLPVIEVLLLGFPILLHTWWGIRYLQTASYNSGSSNGTKPSLSKYSRNHAYTWQRITAWILVFGIVAHVVQMRFVEAPTEVFKGTKKHYFVRLGEDQGLPTLAARLGVRLLNSAGIHSEEAPNTVPYSLDDKLQEQRDLEQKQWIAALKDLPLKKGEVIAIAPNFGTAELLMVRETFKMPIMMVLYTLFVLAACFHGFNGLWTFLITWGVTLSEHSQKVMRTVSTVLMCLVAFLGLAAIWGTYWINLKS